MVELKCDYCGKKIEKYPSQVHRHNFCSRKCLSNYSNKSLNPENFCNLKDYAGMRANMKALNKRLNPTRMTEEVRFKIRNSHLGLGEGKGYAKRFGRAEHRVVAEEILQRELHPGEVVHHIDGNKRNNDPDNLMVFVSQGEHARFHAQLKEGR